MDQSLGDTQIFFAFSFRSAFCLGNHRRPGDRTYEGTDTPWRETARTRRGIPRYFPRRSSYYYPDPHAAPALATTGFEVIFPFIALLVFIRLDVLFNYKTAAADDPQVYGIIVASFNK